MLAFATNNKSRSTLANNYAGNIDYLWIYFIEFKSMASQLIAAIVAEVPNIASEKILQTTQQLIASSLMATEESCDKSSLVALEWEALPSYIDSWVCGLGSDDVLKQVRTIGTASLVLRPSTMQWKARYNSSCE